MVALPRLSLALVVAMTACAFGEEGVAPTRELGEDVAQEEGEESEPVDEPFEPGPSAPTDDPDSPGDDGGAADDGGDGGEPDPSDDGGAADDGSADGGGDDDDDDSAGDDGGSTEPQPNCEDTVELIVWAEDAELEAPMAYGYASQAQGEPAVAYSNVAEQGTITFELEVPCPGTYSVYGLVWDTLPGAWADPDADSLYFEVGGQEVVWRYGCQTHGQTDALSWQPLAALQAQPCTANGVVFEVEEPGLYSLSFRNREAGYDSAVAAIAAIALTTDPELDPYSIYSPY